MSGSRAAGSRELFSDPSVNLYVSDIDASVRFYRDVLGFSETFRFPPAGPPDHVELRLATLRVGLATYDALRRDHGLRTGPGPPRAEIALFADDVDGAHAWATSRGARSLSAPHDFGGYIHRSVVTDPEGTPIVFTTRLPLKSVARSAARPTFRNHLYNVYARDLGASLTFYRDRLGFVETFRAPTQGPPDHVELELGPLNLSVSTLEALKRHHGIDGGGGPPRGEVVLWASDVDATYARMCAEGVPSLSAPHDFAGVLRAAWVGDPDGNPVQLVTRRSPSDRRVRSSA